MHSKLKIENASLFYESSEKGKRIEAFRDIDMQVASGESVCIIGPSGCGKSSLLRAICGLSKLDCGTIEIDGIPVSGPRQETSLILQDFGLLPWKSVFANAELGCKVRHMDRAERRTRAQRALSMVGLDGFERAYPRELSGGMKQRLALARSLALDVDLLLMDEPLSALDTLMRERMQELLFSLWKREGYAQILVTHSIEEAVFLGQRIYVMSARPGKILRVIDNRCMGSDDFRSSAAFYDRCDFIRGFLRETTIEYEQEAVLDCRAAEHE